MIYADGKNRFGVLALAARDAARRFTLRGMIARVRPGSWRPIVLRWRKMTRRRENVVAGRTATKKTIRWFPQFHFHFAMYTRVRDPRKPFPVVSQGTGIHETRVVLDHRRPNHSTTKLPVQTQRIDRAMGWPAADARSLPKEPAWMPAAPPPISWRSVTQPILPAMHRVRGPLFGEKPERVPAGKQSDDARPFQTQSRIWQHWLQVFSLRPSQPVIKPFPRAPEPQALKFQIERPEELVWRRTLRPAKTIDQFEQSSALSDSSRRTPVHFSPAQEAELKVSPAIEKAAVVQVTTLDPSVLDRLTDDVIRRVEQRLRIERERRGL